MYVNNLDAGRPSVGHISWSPDYRAAHRPMDTIAADASMFDHLVPRHGHPPAANDNAPRVPVVGLMGYGGAGKSEVAKTLTAMGFTRTHIKAPLRAMCATLLREAGIAEDMIDRYLDGDLKRETIPEFRRSGTELQQFAGTSFGREFCYPDLWLDLWLARARATINAGGKVVQESVRFPNEAAAIRALGGKVVRVERPGVGPLSEHVSEIPPAEPDHVIHNNGTLTDLRFQVATWLRHSA